MQLSMAPQAPKRASPEDHDKLQEQPRKRRRTSSSLSATMSSDTLASNLGCINIAPTARSHAQLGLQRSIALALNHVGFDSAAPDALQSFALAVETYLESFLEDLKCLALTSRREQPNPADFELTLRRFNIPMRSLKPHRKHLINRNLLEPDYAETSPTSPELLHPLPTLGEELSAQPLKEGMNHIPEHFPEFPSKHTFKSTRREDTDHRDPARIREAAAKSAKQGEDALRGLVRATKIRKQKEVRLMVQRDPVRREGYKLWEEAMRWGMTQRDVAPPDDEAIANASMIVNADSRRWRKVVPRTNKRGLTNAESANGGGPSKRKESRDE